MLGYDGAYEFARELQAVYREVVKASTILEAPALLLCSHERAPQACEYTYLDHLHILGRDNFAGNEFTFLGASWLSNYLSHEDMANVWEMERP